MEIEKLNEKKVFLVAVMPWRETEISSVAFISDKVAKDGVFTSTENRKITISIYDNETVSTDIENLTEDDKSNIGQNGIIKIGSTVKWNDILVSKTKDTTDALNSEEKMLMAIFGKVSRDSSARMPFRDTAMVTDVEVTGSKIVIYLSIKRVIAVGDILFDEKGNEVVVAGIMPEQKMPRIKKDGAEKRIHIVITDPSTIVKDLGQKLHVQYSIADPENIFLAIPKKLSKKETKWEFKDEDAYVGSIKFQKREQLVEKKSVGFGKGEYNWFSRQLQAGVKMSHKFAALLRSNGLIENVKELLTLKSDSIQAHLHIDGSIIRKRPLPEVATPSSVQKLSIILDALCFKGGMFADSDQKLNVMTDTERLAKSSGEVILPESFSSGKIVPNGIFCQKIFGPINNYSCACGKYSGGRISEGTTCRKCGVEVAHSTVRLQRTGHVILALSVVHPFFNRERILQEKLLEEVRKSEDEGTAFGFFKNVDEHMLRAGINSRSVIKVLPVLPAGFRPYGKRGEQFIVDDVNDLYRRIIIRNNRIKRLMEIKAPDIILLNEFRMLQVSVDNLFFGLKYEDASFNLKGLSQRLAETVDTLYNKRVGYSGQSVVVPDSSLLLEECSLPMDMALAIFMPFIVRELTYSMEGDEPKAKSTEIALMMIGQRHDDAVSSLENIASRSVIICTSSDQSKAFSFKARINKGEVVHLHPEAVKALGVSMENGKRSIFIHLPLSDTAQKEAEKLLFSLEIAKCLTEGYFSSSLLFTVGRLAELGSSPDGEVIHLSELDKIILCK